MRVCRDCRFYRPSRPLTQLLARDLGLEDRTVLSEMAKMMEDERQKQDAEAKLIPSIRRAGTDRWDVRPSMSDYCVAEEDSFVVPGIRNGGGNCGTFELHEKEEKDSGSCENCVHRVQPSGPAIDARAESFFASTARANIASGQDGGSGSRGIDDVRETAGARKSFEAKQAYYAGKLTFQPPAYLPYCRMYSTRTDFVPCVVQNPHDRCPDWAPITG
ncbi:MAG TPA: hypothetical protein PLX89_11175 [Verrucomicrobiota bacterium]|nr:hypothetical protein [Verrucomicrobiales bacterium]HRI13558.1 hypothetical protein [Verrucomicrobiota bacterium]